MLLNKKNFKEIDYFDEKFFMYLENDDLCKRVKERGGSIYVVPKSKINQLAAKTVDRKFSTCKLATYSVTHRGRTTTTNSTRS